jgi:predicted dehydrogenase
LRVGIIGTGTIAKLNVLGYIDSSDAEIVAVADVKEEAAAIKLEKWGLRTAKIYTDYRKMVDHEDLDIIEILTPHHLHEPMTDYCAKAEVPGISVQKPMAHTLTACDNMIRICKEKGVKLKLYENFRFYPPYIKAKELLEQGIIGEPLNFRINTIAHAGPGGMDIKHISFDYLWRVRVAKCGGGPWVYDDGIYKFSMSLWLMGQERVEKVFSWIDYYSGVQDIPDQVLFKYPSQNSGDPPKFGSMEFSWAVNMNYPTNYYECDEFIEISGTKGIMWINQCTSGGSFLSDSPQYPPIVVYKDGDVKSYGLDLPRDWSHSFIGSTLHFIDVIKNGISDQEKRPVFWDEISSENEQKGAFQINEFFSYRKALTKGIKFLLRVRKDFKKGKKQGLNIKKAKY